MTFEYALPIGTVLKYKPIFGKESVYTVRKVLGQGGFGITYLVTKEVMDGNIPHHHKYAIKEFFVKGKCWRRPNALRMMMPEAEDAKQNVKDWLEEFLTEAQRLNKICKENSNIVNVNEVFRANDTAYYVMEYIPGGNIRSIVKANGAFPESKALQYLMPIAHAVDFIHSKYELLHCDIKHDNIMLRNNEGIIEPVLIDFGESRHFKDGSLTSTHATTGCSDGFAPIEQYMGVSSFAPQIDVYALAATFFYLLTGHEPRIASDVSQAYLEKELPAGLSPSLRGALIHAMQMDKAKRTFTVADFIREAGGAAPAEDIIPDELPSSFRLRGDGRAFDIVSVVERTPFYVKYKALSGYDEPDRTYGYGATRRSDCEVVEFFDSANQRRDKSGSVLTDASVAYSLRQYLDFCASVTGFDFPAGFVSSSGEGWMSFEDNGTLYLVTSGRKASSGKKKKMWLLAASIVGIFVCLFFVARFLSHTGGSIPVVDSVAALTGKSVKSVSDSIIKTPLDVVYGKCHYTGPVDKKGRPNGRGIAKFMKNGSVYATYEGGFEQGKLQGQNVTFICDSENEKFEGAFDDNRYSKGKVTSTDDGSYYSGTFKSSRKNLLGDTDVGTWYDKDGNSTYNIENGKVVKISETE